MNLKRILNVVGALLLIALVVPFIIYAVPMTVGADHSFVVLTASMTPAIAPGDVVIVADRDPTTIAEGDVITFSRGNNEVPVTHRVITVVDEAGGLAFETKGDANSDPDASLVPAENVVGTVILTIPYIGYVVQFTNTPHGFVALVVGPIALFVASEIWTLYRRPSTAESVSTEETGDEIAPVTEQKDVAEEPVGFVITARTLEGAFLPLVVLAVYSSYVATIQMTELTIAVAVGSVISTIAVLVLLVSARRRTAVGRTSSFPDREESASEQPTADGGIDAGSTDEGDVETSEREGSPLADEKETDQ